MRTPREWKRFGGRIRELTGGEDPDIVVEHPGRESFGATGYVTRKGGTVVACASTSAYRHHGRAACSARPTEGRGARTPSSASPP